MNHNTPASGDPIQAAIAGGRLSEAVMLLREALTAAPDNARLHARLGQVLLLGDRHDDAGLHLRHAATLAPGDWQIQVTLARYQDQVGLYAAASDSYRRTLEIRPGDVDSRWRLGCVLRAQGSLDASAIVLRELLAQVPGDARVLHELGLLHWQRAELDPAELHCSAALEREPENVYFRCTLDSLRAEAEAARVPRRPGAPRVVLHVNHWFHFPILLPIFEQLRAEHHVRITGEPDLACKFRPDVVVCADLQGRRLRASMPGAKMVYVRHGLTSKNHLPEAGAACDFLAGITSETIAGQLVTNHGLRREQIWVTGHVPLDPLFRGTAPPAGLPLKPGRKTILFAPTWNRNLSAADLMRERTVELLRGQGDANVIIKPHPHTGRLRPDWMSAMRAAARAHTGVWLVDDPATDVVPLLGAADVLVSDVSSVMFSWLALDRPVVLVTHPLRAQDPGFDPGGIEWQWRDMGEEVHDIESLPDAVSRALANPASYAAARARCRELLFGELTDGRAAERIAGRISRIEA